MLYAFWAIIIGIAGSAAAAVAAVGNHDTSCYGPRMFATWALLLATFVVVAEEGLMLARRQMNDAETLFATALTDQA